MYRKVLFDEFEGTYIDSWSLRSSELGFEEGLFYVEKERLSGGRQDGVDIVTVDNGRLAFTIVPTRGFNIWRMWIDGLEVSWHSPVRQLVNPKFIDLSDRGGLGWIDGFNEVMCRCGMESNGAPCKDVIIDQMGNKKEIFLTLHGRISNIPASTVFLEVDGETPTLTVGGEVYEGRLFTAMLKLSTRTSTVQGGNWVEIADIVENMSRSWRGEMEMLYHCNFGPPFLEEGGEIVAPFKTVVPRDELAGKEAEEFQKIGRPTEKYVERVYFTEVYCEEDGWSEIALVNRNRDKAVSIKFDAIRLPCLTIWKNLLMPEDGYVVGLEPGVNYPNPKPFEREMGRVVSLEPGEKYSMRLRIIVHLGREEVEETIERIRKIGGGREPKIYPTPRERYAPL